MCLSLKDGLLRKAEFTSFPRVAQWLPSAALQASARSNTISWKFLWQKIIINCSTEGQAVTESCRCCPIHSFLIQSQSVGQDFTWILHSFQNDHVWWVASRQQSKGDENLALEFIWQFWKGRARLLCGSPKCSMISQHSNRDNTLQHYNNVTGGAIGMSYVTREQSSDEAVLGPASVCLANNVQHRM